MKTAINIKGYAGSKAKIKQLYYDYKQEQYSIKDFLTETVLLTIEKYQKDTLSQELFKTLTNEEIEEKSSSGKIDFGYHYNSNKVDINKAIDTAIKAFNDGIVIN